METDGSCLSTALTRLGGECGRGAAIDAWTLCGTEQVDCEAVHVQQILYEKGCGQATAGGGGDTDDDGRGS